MHASNRRIVIATGFAAAQAAGRPANGIEVQPDCIERADGFASAPISAMTFGRTERCRA
jgi:hypothetical protein